jgi:hypothetical protein
MNRRQQLLADYLVHFEKPPDLWWLMKWILDDIREVLEWASGRRPGWHDEDFDCDDWLTIKDGKESNIIKDCSGQGHYACKSCAASSSVRASKPSDPV